MIRRKTSRIKNMFKNKSLKARIAAAVLAAAVAFTSFDVTAFAGNSSDSSNIYEENIAAGDISADDYDISDNNEGDIDIKSPSNEKELEEEMSKLNESFFLGNNATGYITDYSNYKEIPTYAPNSDDEDEHYYSNIPSSYMNSFYQVKAKFPETRSQSPFGSCWAHQSVFLMESDLITNYAYSRDIDLSEMALIYYSFYSLEDNLGGTRGDTSYCTNTGTYSYIDCGGSIDMAFYTLNQWLGVMDEEYAPYPHSYESALKVIADGVTDEHMFEESPAYLTNMRTMKFSTNTAEIKAEIMKHGAVAIAFMAGDYKDSPIGVMDYVETLASYNSSYNSFYRDPTKYNAYAEDYIAKQYGLTPGEGYYDFYYPVTDHGVAIVGWDDNFSRTKFNYTPSRDGAWLIRNSWSTTAGENLYSYFWMSYDEPSLADRADSFSVVPSGTYDNNYQYDGGRDSAAYNITKYANVFTVGGTGNTPKEKLEAVSFKMTQYAGVDYTIKVYTNVTSGPESGTLVSEATTVGKTDFAGYYTVELANPVVLEKGTKFSIVIETSGGYIDIEKNYNWGGLFNSSVSSEPGQSYYYWYNSWKDTSSISISVGNACIKAFTSNMESELKGRYKINFDGNGASSGTMASKTAPIGTSLILPDNTFTRTNYKFAGWNTEPDGTGTAYKSVVSSLPEYTELTLYAQWIPLKYSVDFSANGGVGATILMENLLATDKLTFPQNTFTKTGYYFAGWSRTTQGAEPVFSAGQAISVEVTNDNDFAHFYAVWKPCTYRISFNPGDGTVSPTFKDVVYNQLYGELPIPTKNDADFLGWYTESAGGIKIEADDIVDITEDAILYAHWRRNICTVRFDLNGGAFAQYEENPAIVSYNQAIVKPSDPIKPGSIFIGWKLETEEELFDFITPVTDDITLVAQWEYAYKVADLTAMPESGSELEIGDRITLSSETSGVRIYYTRDGSIPTEESTLYSDAIIVDSEEDIIIKAFAVKDSYNPSDTTTFIYTVKRESEDWGDLSEEDRSAFASPQDIPTGLWVAGVEESVEYTGLSHKFDNLRVYDNKKLLAANSSYKIAYKNNINAGTATITISGLGNYKDSLTKTFKITPVEIDAQKVTVPDVKYRKEKGNAFSSVRIIGLNGAILKKGTDFNVVYTYKENGLVIASSKIVPENTEVIATISGKGNYKTTTPIIAEFKVTSRSVVDISKATIIVNEQYYTGEPIDLSGKINVTVGTKKLIEDEDFVISDYSANHTNVGKATVTIEGIYKPEEGKYYTGAKTVKFNIKAKSLSLVNIDVKLKDATFSNWTSDLKTDYEYTGKPVNPVVRLTDQETVLTEGRDYTVKYTNNINPTSSKKVPTVTIKGKGNYSGSITRKYDITKQLLVAEECMTNYSDVFATNLAGSYKLKVDIRDKNERQLTENKDYKLSYYKDGVPVSTSYKPAKGDKYFVRISGIGGYTGYFEQQITARGQLDISINQGQTYEDSVIKVSVEDTVNSGSYIPYSPLIQADYTSKGARLKIVVANAESSLLLEEGKDYTVSYKNNKARALYTAVKAPTLVITGKGRYKGTLLLKYSITYGSVFRGSVTAADKVYSSSQNGFVSKPVVKDCFGNTLKAGTDYTVVYKYATDTQLKNGTIRKADTVIASKDVLPVGTQVKLEVTGKGNYVGTWTSNESYEGSGIYASYRIISGNISKAKVSIKEQTYTGKAITPGKSQITVKIGKTTLSAADYEIVSYSNNIAKGTAKLVLRGVGNYSGTKTATFKITQRSMFMTVIFNGNGATGGSTKKMTILSGKSVKLNAFGFTKKGYVPNKELGVWNTKPDGSGIYYSDRDVITNNGCNGDTLVLYAQWR